MKSVNIMTCLTETPESKLKMLNQGLLFLILKSDLTVYIQHQSPHTFCQSQCPKTLIQRGGHLYREMRHHAWAFLEPEIPHSTLETGQYSTSQKTLSGKEGCLPVTSFCPSLSYSNECVSFRTEPTYCHACCYILLSFITRCLVTWWICRLKKIKPTITQCQANLAFLRLSWKMSATFLVLKIGKHFCSYKEWVLDGD